jgi:hypothetical protein
VVLVGKLGQLLCGVLGHPVDVPRDGSDFFGDPHRRGGRAGSQGSAEHAGSAREHEAPDALRYRLLEEVERAGHSGVDEVLPAVRADVRLMQACCMNDGVRSSHTRPDNLPVGHATDHIGVCRCAQVDANDLVTRSSQGPH